VVYLYLLFSAFLSATLLPLGSEALLILYIKDGYSLELLLLFATTGNSLGSLLNYFIGLKGEKFLKSKSYISESRFQKSKTTFNRYGGYSLLLSPLPVIGDPLTLFAGLMRYNLLKFILIVTTAKFVRYLLVASVI
jgi:membrane protein YqaA with SNARE-associated domain